MKTKGTLFDEAPCRGEADAGGTACDDRNFPLKLSHDFPFRGVGTACAPENLEMGSSASVVQCGKAHIGGAKSIRLDDRRRP
jgi:hypothetical protein